MSPTNSYPITLTNVDNKLAVVIGGGPVGQRKVQKLLEAGIEVRLVSPEITPRLQTWVDSCQLEWQPRPYHAGDLTGAYLVFAATNQRSVNAQIAHEAQELGILCNVADDPQGGTFHVPAVYRGEQVSIAISTAGHSPKRAKQLRDAIAEWLEHQA